MRIILASTSPIRKQMLTQAGIKFEAMSPLCEEEDVKKHFRHLPLIELALVLGAAKAKSISDVHKDTYVIGSDQICEFEGRNISKTKSQQEAFDCLKMLQGKTHKQNNGTCVYFDGECVMEHSESAKLKMKKLSDEEIWEYIKKDDPVGSAGSYKYELNGKYLFEEVSGTAQCIQGFSLDQVVEFLKKKNA